MAVTKQPFPLGFDYKKGWIAVQRGLLTFVIAVLVGGGVLTAYAPDTLSMLFIIIMEVVLIAGVFGGVLPVIRYNQALLHGTRNIQRATEVQTSSTWAAVLGYDSFFQQRTMDEFFDEYRSKVKDQQASGQILCDITEYINEDVLALHSWQTLVCQIPGMMTGLGILGTFIGLLIGIRGIGFSTVSDALTSVQTLLSGIQVAFYTSIAGVILSLLFNIAYRFAWNMMLRNLGVFTDSFHKNVIPSVEEQTLYRERREYSRIADLLERLPKIPEYSTSNPAAPAVGGDHEKILMPQILAGLQNNEFTFQLQPKFDINTRKIIGAEALVRWNHGKMGVVLPSVFIPVLEQNGYITKLDQYIWESVCKTLRQWIDAGLRPVPLSINVTKMDILAMDVVEYFTGLVKKYRIPPRYLEIEIAETAYLNAAHSVMEIEEKLRAEGFRVVIDGFDGDFIVLKDIDTVSADAIKLDLRRFAGKQSAEAIAELFTHARRLKLNLTAEGIETMEQLTMLRKSGCSEGQGFLLSKPLSIQEFEELTNKETTK